MNNSIQNNEEEIDELKKMLDKQPEDELSRDKPVKEKISRLKPKLKQSSLGKSIVFRGENKARFEELRQNLLAELCPHTKIQESLANKFIFLAWESERAMMIERDMLSKQNTRSNKNYRWEKWIKAHGKSAVSEYEFEDSEQGQKRLRKVRNLDLTDPDIKEIIRYQSHLQKEMLKLLDRIRSEQALQNNPQTNA